MHCLVEDSSLINKLISLCLVWANVYLGEVCRQRKRNFRGEEASERVAENTNFFAGYGFSNRNQRTASVCGGLR